MRADCVPMTNSGAQRPIRLPWRVSGRHEGSPKVGAPLRWSNGSGHGSLTRPGNAILMCQETFSNFESRRWCNLSALHGFLEASLQDVLAQANNNLTLPMACDVLEDDLLKNRWKEVETSKTPKRADRRDMYVYIDAENAARRLCKMRSRCQDPVFRSRPIDNVLCLGFVGMASHFRKREPNVQRCARMHPRLHHVLKTRLQ